MRFTDMVLMVLGLTGLISWLNYTLLARQFHFYRQQGVRYAYWLVSAGALAVTYYSRIKPPSSAKPEDEFYYWLLYVALAWICGQLALILFQAIFYIAERVLFVAAKLARPAEYSGAAITRRKFLQGAATVLPLAAVGTGARGIYQAQVEMAVKKYDLTFPGLSANLNGYKIGQISDTHLGPYFSLERLDTVIQLLKEEQPDVVVITGDLADDLQLLRPALSRLDALVPFIPQGIYFCFGNHEYIRNITRFRAELANSRLVLLENSSQMIVPGEQPLYLLGVDYPGSDVSRSALDISVSRRQQFFAAANENIPENAFKVLLAHHPDFLFDSFAAQIPLTLAGHTHGGQVVIGGKSLLDQHVYMRGLYQENGVYGYVSCGAGHWFPFRLGCPPEISLFTLHGSTN